MKKLPDSLCNLSRLQCLHLHKNLLVTLPHGLIHIRSLSELSLRENPLVMRFVRDMEYQPSSLLEIAARSIKTEKVAYTKDDPEYADCDIEDPNGLEELRLKRVLLG